MKQIKFSDVAVSTVKTEGNTYVKEIIKNEKSIYFTTADGFFVRLSYEGVCGWRLQANTEG